MVEEDSNYKMKTEIHNVSKTIPRGFHKPSAGYAAIANKYLWAEDDNEQSTENTHSEGSFQNGHCERGKNIRLKFRPFQDIPYSSLPFMVSSNPHFTSDQNASRLTGDKFRNGNNVLSRNIDKMVSCFNTITLVLGNLLIKIIIHLRKQNHSRILSFGVTMALFLGIVVPFIFERSELRVHQIRMRLIGNNISSAEKFIIEDSPQMKALQWITEYDPLQLNPLDRNILDRYALAVFYFSMTTIDDMVQWDGNTWLSGLSICQWKGVLCTKTSQTALNFDVIGLNLTHVQGQLPGKELAALSQLQWLHFGQSNQISGSLPTEVGLLTQLTILSLGNNQLTGSIPSEISALTQLELLGLYNNHFNSTIPSEIGNLSKLVVASLDGNQITGHIPTTVGLLQDHLVDLRLSHNLLEGSIPFEIGSLSNLHLLFLNSNQLSGSLPPQLSKLKHLKQLYIQHNNLFGVVAASICALSKAQHFKIRVDCDKLSCSCCAPCSIHAKQSIDE